MTLEERMGRLERTVGSLMEASGKAQVSSVLNHERDSRRLATLERRLKELDVMVLAIHDAIKDIQERV